MTLRPPASTALVGRPERQRDRRVGGLPQVRRFERRVAEDRQLEA